MNTEKLEKEIISLKEENKSLVQAQQGLKAEIKKLGELPPKIVSGYKVGRVIYKRQQRVK